MDCQSQIIINDKETGNFRENVNYTEESIVMMHLYDIDKDGRLNYK